MNRLGSITRTVMCVAEMELGLLYTRLKKRIF